MRVLYIDIDSLRVDHLGCYGYHRNTSPYIDSIAERGIRFNNNYVSDAPCLPSRTALWSGRFGYHTGVIDHGGVASQPINQPDRGFRDSFGTTGWMAQLRKLGMKTATISPFGERHSAWHWYAGYNEVYNTGKNGMERADEVTPIAVDWIKRHAEQDNWFLHLNLWDPHTPYRTPEDYDNDFQYDPLPEHIDEDYWQAGWNGYGPHSPQEISGFDDGEAMSERWNVPGKLDSMEQVRWWIDHYDMGIRYADDHVGMILKTLEDAGIRDETIIIISADHGENQGELNVWGDHQTADYITCRVPLIIDYPGEDARIDDALHYHVDWAATLIELLGGEVPSNWDGQPFTEAFKQGKDEGREYVVVSQGAWACQRGVRFNHEGKEYMCLRTYHDGYKMMDDIMLFNLTDDPHEQHNLRDSQPELVQKGLAYLEDWLTEMMLTGEFDTDPMMTVLRQGGALHTRGALPAYLERLRATGRGEHADYLEQKHPNDL